MVVPTHMVVTKSCLNHPAISEERYSSAAMALWRHSATFSIIIALLESSTAIFNEGVSSSPKQQIEFSPEVPTFAPEMAWSWPDFVFIICSIVTVPPYLVILVLLIFNKKTTRLSTPFYSQIISQGFGDILYIVTYVSLITFGYVSFKMKLSPLLMQLVVSVAVRVLIYCLALRCLGVMFISFQRYITLCHSSSIVYMWIDRASPIRIIFIHWFVATLISLPVLLVRAPKLGPDRSDALQFEDSSFKVLVAVSYASVFPTFLICTFCYTAVLREIFANRPTLSRCSKDVKREIQICIQVSAFVFAFALLFAFYLAECILLLAKVKPPPIMPLMHPLVSGFMSFVIPWTLLFFNEEITQMIKRRMETALPPTITVEPTTTVWSTRM
ncbi:hypothetical protein GCK32_003250 [Trichostrongylus colubriformis]|uniref:G-protein coupled receptors family 1 profile domain-containing protein n=1 Tax=Trichostrongylus colubriformis TaxID=6319 RepID=A0AAN8EVZ3_TRICO